MVSNKGKERGRSDDAARPVVPARRSVKATATEATSSNAEQNNRQVGGYTGIPYAKNTRLDLRLKRRGTATAIDLTQICTTNPGDAITAQPPLSRPSRSTGGRAWKLDGSFPGKETPTTPAPPWESCRSGGRDSHIWPRRSTISTSRSTRRSSTLDQQHPGPKDQRLLPRHVRPRHLRPLICEDVRSQPELRPQALPPTRSTASSTPNTQAAAQRLLRPGGRHVSHRLAGHNAEIGHRKPVSGIPQGLLRKAQDYLDACVRSGDRATTAPSTPRRRRRCPPCRCCANVSASWGTQNLRMIKGIDNPPGRTLQPAWRHLLHLLQPR